MEVGSKLELFRFKGDNESIVALSTMESALTCGEDDVGKELKTGSHDVSVVSVLSNSFCLNVGACFVAGEDSSLSLDLTVSFTFITSDDLLLS